jgi:predicted permease
MLKIIISFSLILFGLFLGYGIQLLINRGCITLPVTTEQLRKRLQKVALLFLNPVAIVGAVWAVDIKSVSIAALPLVGFFALVAGGILALGFARLMKLEPEKKGAMFCCGSFTNIGSIGALICFVFLGEAGFALVPIYKLFEEVSYYSIGFPIARLYAGSDVDDRKVSERLLGLARDPFILVAVSSILIGGLLNWSDLPRPGFYKLLITVFVPLGTVILLTSIGLALRLRRVRAYLRESAVVAAIKFLMVPLCATTLAYFIGFGRIDGGLPLKVVMILSAMPVAFNALIPPSIYDLDLDLANSCWFVTTALLVVVLPLLLFALYVFF